VIDMQVEVIRTAHQREAVVAKIGDLIGKKARREGVPVVWVQHYDQNIAKGSPAWLITPELKPNEVDRIIEKSYGDV
jgi:nicotinamidase-related amidase